MRQSNGAEVLELNGKLIGINLGADYCAEHEWGINGLKTKLGIDSTKLGLEGRKISKSSPDLEWLENVVMVKKPKPTMSGIWLDRRYGDHPHYFDGFPHGNVYAQWASGGFCMMSSDPATVSKLKRVHEAFATNDIVIWLGGGGVFKNSGLCIGIASALPEDISKSWYDHDVESNKLKADFAATGIEEKLKRAGKKYFALAPNRRKDGSLHFWLNPMEQDQNNYGWFDLADLEAWCRNEGPIPMKKNKKDRRR